MSVCRSCRAPVLWVEMKSGKKNPLDPQPDIKRGNVMIVRDPLDADLYDCKVGQAVALSDRAADVERFRGVKLYISHFATCPRAGQHRKR